jgi:hypothetical protein
MEDFLGKFSCTGVVCHCLLLPLHVYYTVEDELPCYMQCLEHTKCVYTLCFELQLRICLYKSYLHLKIKIKVEIKCSLLLNCVPCNKNYIFFGFVDNKSVRDLDKMVDTRSGKQWKLALVILCCTSTSDRQCVCTVKYNYSVYTFILRLHVYVWNFSNIFNNFLLVFKVTGESQIMRISLPNRPIEVGASLSFFFTWEQKEILLLKHVYF